MLVNNRGKIIVIEGSDGSGKKTQTKLIFERALSKGLKVETLSFPRYGTPTGQKIKDYLNGKLGSLDEVDTKYIAKLYAEDRLSVKPLMMNWLNEGKTIILDRYTESNMAHQGGTFWRKGEQQVREMVEWIRKLEIEEMGLPESDLVIYLYLPVEWTIKAMEGERRVRDLHEQNAAHLIDTENCYKWLADHYKNWKRIDCIRNNERITVEETTDIIWKIAEPMFYSESVHSLGGDFAKSK